MRTTLPHSEVMILLTIHRLEHRIKEFYKLLGRKPRYNTEEVRRFMGY